jgi:hypothetical protein
LNEGTKLANILQQQLGWHAARTQFAAAFVLALLRLRTVNFPSLALCSNPHAKCASNERRLQRFFAGFNLDSDAFAKLLFTLTPASGPLVVTLDRTHWQVGRVDVNVLLFAIAHRGVAFPIVWKLLGKPGNSNQAEQEAPRLERLLALLALAFVFAYRVGEWLAEHKPIRLKRHGRKEKRVFRLGLDYLHELLLNSPHRCDEFGRCLRTLLRV